MTPPDLDGQPVHNLTVFWSDWYWPVKKTGLGHKTKETAIQCCGGGDGTGLFGLSLHGQSQLFLKVNEKAAKINSMILQTYGAVRSVFTRIQPVIDEGKREGCNNRPGDTHRFAS